MIGILGYNFLSDFNVVDPLPTAINNIYSTKIQNGIFDHLLMTKDVSSAQDTWNIPTDWDFNTIFNADFNGNTNAGNITESLRDITGVKIKRRIKGTFDWITLKEFTISAPEELSFVLTDHLNANDTEYEYAFVPVTNNVEGNYIIESIMSQFNGIFICDVDTVYKFRAGAVYGNMTQNQQVGVFQTFNRQYPVVVSNGQMNYKTSSIQGYVMPPNFDQEHNFSDTKGMIAEREKLLKFLTDKKAKIIKDNIGNNWLCFITGSPNVMFASNSYNSIASVSVDWTEMGDPANKSDLYENGLIPTEG